MMLVMVMMLAVMIMVVFVMMGGMIVMSAAAVMAHAATATAAVVPAAATASTTPLTPSATTAAMSKHLKGGQEQRGSKDEAGDDRAASHGWFSSGRCVSVVTAHRNAIFFAPRLAGPRFPLDYLFVRGLAGPVSF